MKKTLLIAAAALVAGVISSEAQVYSANIVGYVNVAAPAGVYTAVANPLDLDTINNVTNVLASAPNGTSALLWNGAGYTTVTKSLTGHWGANASTAFIAPGAGFLLKPGATYTNTFVGTVIPNVPGTNNLALSAGVYQFVGSVLPVSGSISNAVDQGISSLNLGSSLPNGSKVLTWNGSGWNTATKNLATGKWTANPTISVGQGILVLPAGATTWTQWQ